MDSMLSVRSCELLELEACERQSAFDMSRRGLLSLEDDGSGDIASEEIEFGRRPVGRDSKCRHWWLRHCLNAKCGDGSKSKEHRFGQQTRKSRQTHRSHHRWSVPPNFMRVARGPKEKVTGVVD